LLRIYPDALELIATKADRTTVTRRLVDLCRVLTMDSLRRFGRSGAVIRFQVGDDLPGLAGIDWRADGYHAVHDRFPLPAGTRDGDHAVDAVADPAGAGDKVCPGTIGQFHGSGRQAGDRHTRSEVGGEIFDHIVNFVRPDLRAAQDHVVDLPAPACLAHAQLSDRPRPVALGAGDGDGVTARSSREWAGLLGFCSEAQEEDTCSRQNEPSHDQTFRVRLAAIE
jgi:hypothetical protein